MQLLQRSGGPDLGKSTIEVVVDGASEVVVRGSTVRSTKFVLRAEAMVAIGMHFCKCISVTGQRDY